jgi:hypothetical protein
MYEFCGVCLAKSDSLELVTYELNEKLIKLCADWPFAEEKCICDSCKIKLLEAR